MNAPVSPTASVSERLSATGTANALELRGVSKYFGALAAMEDVNLTVRPGERRVVHHVLLYAATASEVDALDAADPSLGYTQW